MRAYLDACLAADARTIYLVDGPAVLGWRRWREIDGAYSPRLLREGGGAALAGESGRDADALTTLLSGACNEAALWLADAPDDTDRKRAVDMAIDDLVKRLFSQ